MLKYKLPAGGFPIVLFLFPVLCTAQSISIVSGNGQLVCAGCVGTITQALAPLTVQVNDANGNPVTTTTVVTWTQSAPGFTPITLTSNTGTNGQASYTPKVIAPSNGLPYLVSTVVASAPKVTTSASFTETVMAPNSFGVAPVGISLSPPGLPPPLTGSAGSTGAPIKVVVLLSTGGGVPGVQVRLTSGTAAGQPTVNCVTSGTGQQTGTVLTDQTGTATCTPMFGLTGEGSYTIVVGGNYADFLPAALNVTSGPPAIIKTVSGTPQSANPGDSFPAPLIAVVTDLGGDLSNQAKVIWAVSPPGSVVLSNEVTSSGSNGQVTARATAGSTGGPATVTVSISGSSATPATFSLTVNVIYTALQIISGNGQTAVINKPFLDPLVVQVNDGTTPVSGATVNFTVTSGSASLSVPSASTGTNGQAQVSVTAGATVGPIVITASVGSGAAAISQTFNLNAAPIGPTISAIQNAAGFQNNFISPCSLATIYGTGLATGITGYVSYFIAPPMQMAGVTVEFGGSSAPILNVVNENGTESVSVQVPCDVVPGPTVPLVVTVNGGSTTTTADVIALSPGVFQTVMSDGKLRPVMLRPDGSVVSLENPARLGETTRMYLTGLGQTTPPFGTDQFVPLVPDPTTGDLIPQDLNVDMQVVVGVNNSGLALLSAKYAYGMIGVYELTFQLPAQAPTGTDVPFEVFECQTAKCNTVVFGNGTTIPLQP